MHCRNALLRGDLGDPISHAVVALAAVIPDPSAYA